MYEFQGVVKKVSDLSYLDPPERLLTAYQQSALPY